MVKKYDVINFSRCSFIVQFNPRIAHLVYSVTGPIAAVGKGGSVWRFGGTVHVSERSVLQSVCKYLEIIRTGMLRCLRELQKYRKKLRSSI